VNFCVLGGRGWGWVWCGHVCVELVRRNGVGGGGGGEGRKWKEG
jgi:hypothetical protein